VAAKDERFSDQIMTVDIKVSTIIERHGSAGMAQQLAGSSWRLSSTEIVEFEFHWTVSKPPKQTSGTDQ